MIKAGVASRWAPRGPVASPTQPPLSTSAGETSVLLAFTFFPLMDRRLICADRTPPERDGCCMASATSLRLHCTFSWTDQLAHDWRIYFPGAGPPESSLKKTSFF